MKPTRILIAALSLTIASPAFPHAMLDRAIPLVGSRVKASPVRVELWFSEDLEPAFSTVKVVDSVGRQVDLGDKTFDSANRAHVVVSVKALPAGRYRVIWRALSIDTHATSGTFTFDVSP